MPFVLIFLFWLVLLRLPFVFIQLSSVTGQVQSAMLALLDLLDLFCLMEVVAEVALERLEHQDLVEVEEEEVVDQEL